MGSARAEEVREGRGEICNQILRSLPQWFGIESAIQNYVSDVEQMTMFVAYDGARPIGFVSLHSHNDFTAEVHVMAVMPQFHRSGIGRRLIEVAEEHLRKSKFEFLSVKTLSPSRPNKEYEFTRRFYYSMGFKPVEEFKTLWGETNPCLMMIKAL